MNTAFPPNMSSNQVNPVSSTKTLVSDLKLSFEQYRSSVAIDAPKCRLTYAELDELTFDIALKLRSRCGEQRLKSEPIAILMSRSVELYIAQVAVLRAGGFFLPIDPAQPAERIEFVLSDSQASLVLVRESDSFTVSQSSAVPFPIAIEEFEQGSVGRKREPSGGPLAGDGCDEASATDLAYMIYTSGSSGQPKGVPISHQAIWNLCHCWSEELGITQGERSSQLLSVGFDASLEEIFPPLVTGGTVVPVPPDSLNSIKRILEFMESQQINNLHVPTALFHTMVASFETHPSLELPPSVGMVVFGGEKVDPTLIASWFSQVGTDVRLINAYGPTEAAVASSYTVVKPGRQPTIGKPIRGVSFCVVGEDGQPVKAGQPGELYIGGAGIASEYWNRKQLSAEKFVPSPLSDGQMCYRTGDLVRLGDCGNYEFIGRIDDQIKLRGYRIEPGEISSCLGNHPHVSHAHVVARSFSEASSVQNLVGYVVAKTGEKLNEDELKEFLRQRLPAYMIPVAIVEMDSFPVTTGGKLDLDRFPSPVENQGAGGKTRLLTATEQKVCIAWEKILGVGGLGREANFFEIGGDSLSAMRLVLLLEAEFPGPVIPVVALIPNPTIASIADYIDQRTNGSAEPVPANWPLLTRLDDSRDPVGVICVHAAGGSGMFYRQLFEGLELAIPVGILEPAILYQDGPVVCDQQKSVAEIARDYVDCIIEAGCAQRLTLVGYSFGGLLAFEMARLLKLKGFDIKQVVNIDSPNPQAITPRRFLSKLYYSLGMREILRQRIDCFRSVLKHKKQMKEIEQHVKAGVQLPAELRSLALATEFVRLAKKFAPQPSEVPMHLIRGHELEPRFFKPEDYGWTENVSELTVTRIPGGHFSIFTEPYLQDLKEAFRKSLLG